MDEQTIIERAIQSATYAFKRADLNHNGVLEPEEYRKMLNEFLSLTNSPPIDNDEFKLVFNSMDTNHDGVIQLNEYIDKAKHVFINIYKSPQGDEYWKEVQKFQQK